MQPMHKVHPSKRHERSSGSLHNLYDNDPKPNQFSMNQRGQYQQHSTSNSKVPPSQSRSIPRNNNKNNKNYYVPPQTPITQSSSFTEAHSNNTHKNMTLQSLKSSQSIPSPLTHRNERTERDKKPKSKTMYANSNPMSGLQHPSIGKIMKNKNKNNKNNDPNLFTLHGILRIMKQQDPNYQMVTLGMDLTQLGGLDLNCPEPEIHHTFLSPWLDKWDDSNKFVTPNCYKLKHNEHPPIKFIKRYKDTTLFYIFYSCVNDKMQVIAAKELYQRHWVYHKTLQIWLKSASNKQIKKMSKDKKEENEKKIDDKNKDNLEQDAAITFMKNVSVQQIEYFDVECWGIKKHFYSKYPIDWNKERKKLLHEHQLNYFYKACTDSYPKTSRHQH